MNWEDRGQPDGRLDALFEAYREACAAPEPSASFMPGIWRRIEERQRSVAFFGHWARRLATAAAVASLAMAAYLYIPRFSHSGSATESYVEMLASVHAADSSDSIDAAMDEM
jgi:hypothetical protein